MAEEAGIVKENGGKWQHVNGAKRQHKQNQAGVYSVAGAPRMRTHNTRSLYARVSIMRAISILNAMSGASSGRINQACGVSAEAIVKERSKQTGKSASGRCGGQRRAVRVASGMWWRRYLG